MFTVCLQEVLRCKRKSRAVHCGKSTIMWEIHRVLVYSSSPLLWEGKMKRLKLFHTGSLYSRVLRKQEVEFSIKNLYPTKICKRLPSIGPCEYNIWVRDSSLVRNEHSRCSVLKSVKKEKVSFLKCISRVPHYIFILLFVIAKEYISKQPSKDPSYNVHEDIQS